MNTVIIRKEDKSIVGFLEDAVAVGLADGLLSVQTILTREEVEADTSFAQKSINSVRKSEILAELEAIDTASIRSLRAVSAGTATTADTDKLVDLDAQAVALRSELSEIS